MAKNSKQIAEEMLKLIGGLPGVRDPEGKTLAHGAWMMEQVLLGEFPEDKAGRWIGYAQAIYVFVNIATLDNFKEMNKGKDSG